MKIRFLKRMVCMLLALAVLWSMVPAAAASGMVNQEPWNGRSAVFVGDSITAGSGTEKIYYQYLQESLGLGSVTAMGVAGSCVSAASDYGQSHQPLISRWQNIPSADLILVFMGTNDYGHETPLGTAEETGDGTFYGALNTIVSGLVEKHPSGKLVFVTPMHRYGFGTSKLLGTGFTYDHIPNGAGATLEDYVNAIKTVCAEYGADVIDLYTECTLDPSDAAVRSAYMPDGLHPNAAGHELIAGIMEAHIRGYEPGEAAAETELIYGNKFASGYSQENRVSSRRNRYLKAGTVITLKDPDVLQWACAKTDSEISSNNLGYFPDSSWSDKEAAVVETDGWVGFTFKYRDESRTFDLSKPLSDYITIEESHVHVYENGVCTICGEAHPNLENYRGKVISVLGDSISTFAGYIPVADGFNLEHLPRYPQDDLLTDVNETWWMQIIASLDARLGINDSWRGATVSGAHAVTTGSTGENAAMHNLTRVQNLGSNGTPDVILFYGGTNDLAHVSKVGTFDPASAPDTVDLTTKKWDNLADGYVHTLLRLKHFYPETQILCLLPTVTKTYYSDTKLAQGNKILKTICDHYGVAWVDLRESGITTKELPDGIHPDAAGMDCITAAAMEVLLAECEQEPGENRVYRVTHNLEDAKAALGYYKGISAGKAFTEVLSGEKLTVTVTMGGQDVTDSVYAGGVVSVSSVTGDLVITARGAKKPVYADYLLDLPEKFCAGTNLWTVLEHSKSYYTATGWGVHSSGKVTSVTIPVKPGDQLYATSFRKAGENGGTIDGIRVTWFGETEVLDSMGADKVCAEFTAKGCLTAPEGAKAVCIPMWMASDQNEVYLLNREHGYENGVCTGCGAVDPNAAEPLSLRYDDHYDVTGKTVEIVDAGKPTSWQVGYGLEENTVADTAVVTREGDFLVATGIGTAKVRIDGTLCEITVEPAPISLLLLIGQSNMQGIDGDPSGSIVCPAGQVYATYADRYKKTVEDVTKFAPSALSGEYSMVNVTGDAACLEKYPVNMLTDAGSGREGMDSGIAYEWVKQTGEKVWTVNAGYGGSSIKKWQKGGIHYEACLDLFAACKETLRKEIDAGHFTLSHMAYFWCQGCADETNTAQWYVDQFVTMHETLKNTMSFDGERTFEFAGIIPIRSGHQGMGSYRAGVYQNETSVPYYQSFKDLRFNGPRVAQYWMGNNPELADIWNVCTIQESWATLPDGSDGVAEYFRSAYPEGTVDYPTQAKQSAAWYRPVTPAAVHDNIHYNQIGYNELGRESARNALILLGEIPEPDVLASVKFLAWDGFTQAEKMTAATTGTSGTLAVPVVSPVWKSKEVTYKTTEDLCYEYYDLLAKSVRSEGMLTAEGAEGTVAVVPRELTSFRWVLDDVGLTGDTTGGQSENPLVKLAGTVSDGRFSAVRYQAGQAVQLLHSEQWCVEVELVDWTATSGSMILSTSDSAAEGAPYFYFRPRDFFVGIGCYNGSTYDNYGISLKEYGIACSEGTHTYRFVNRVAEDGTNMVYLLVDGREIGMLTDHYVNSTLDGRGDRWLSGKDFAMPYFGTTMAPVSGCTVGYIAVTESAYDPDIHLHDWSEWLTVREPGPEGPGEAERSCSGCGETEKRDVNGVWQTHDLDEHMTSLPASFCSETNLWSVVPHDPMYYHSGERWARHESGSVFSVTVPVSGGEKIYATSFGKYGENGNTIGTGNGIRVTFFGLNGVLKTVAPQDTYAEFSANGGYLLVPEGSVAVNVPMYSDSDDNELYILNREHIYENGICVGCGAVQPGAGPEEEKPAGNMDWFFERMKQEDSFLWASMTYGRLVEKFGK